MNQPLGTNEELHPGSVDQGGKAVESLMRGSVRDPKIWVVMIPKSHQFKVSETLHMNSMNLWIYHLISIMYELTQIAVPNI